MLTQLQTLLGTKTGLKIHTITGGDTRKIKTLERKMFTAPQWKKIDAVMHILENFSSTYADMSGQKCSSSQRVYENFKSYFFLKENEEFIVVMLDSKNVVIAQKTISIGSLNFCIVHPREVFKDAIKVAANSVILLHSHPTGDCTPSNEDIQTTKRLCSVGEVVGIKVLDHIIIGDPVKTNGGYLSFVESNLM